MDCITSEKLLNPPQAQTCWLDNEHHGRYMFGMSLIKKLCLVGVALMLLLAGVFAWNKGLLPFAGRVNHAVEQTGAAKVDSGSNPEPDSAQDESPQQAPSYPASNPAPDSAADWAADKGAAHQTPEKAPDQEAGEVVGNAAGEKPAAEAEASPTPIADEEDAATDEAVVHGTVEKGDTVIKMLAGADSQAAQEYINAAKRVFSMRAFRDGQPYVVVTDTATGKVKRFEYEIDSRRRLVVEGMEQPVARVEAIEYTTLLSTVNTVIEDNLFQAVADAGERPQLALRLAELFGSEVNFIRDLQEGDSFAVLVEKRYRDGEYKGYGRIIAAHFTSRGKTFEAYLFREGNKAASYYNSKGENVRKSLLQAPLAFTRVTSRFTHNRLHPVLGYSRPHEGVDYAAPTGTPVKAVGEGVVTAKGWSGGYGNQVIVRHGGGLESLYSHLSGYARGIRNGQKVRQGEVIGFVGMTGLATGPHLDFRLRQSGKFINPGKAINPRGEPVSKAAMAAFERIMAQELALLKGEKSVVEYTADSIVPDQMEQPQPEKAAEPEKKAEKRKKKRRD